MVSYSAAIVMSSVVGAAHKRQLLLAALERWPFLRLPAQDDFAEQLLVSPPETSPHLHPTEVTLRQAFSLNNQVYEQLPRWSTAFPNVRFAMVEAECVGGECRYGGYVCQAGATLIEVIAHRHGHMMLLGQLGMVVMQPFAPFGQGYFRQGNMGYLGWSPWQSFS
jgi:hypothetical protein